MPPRSDEPITALEDPVSVLRDLALRAHADGELAAINAARDVVIAEFGSTFSPENLFRLTAEDFRSFLLFENNRHWMGIHRHVGSITSDMDALRATLSGLLDDEKTPIAERLDSIVRDGQASSIRGLGKAVITPILLVVYPNKYGVWNSIAESGMKTLGVWPRFDRGDSFGKRYEKVNKVLLSLAERVEIDLWTLDTLWWGVEKAIRSGVTSATATEPEFDLSMRTTSAWDHSDGSEIQIGFSLERHLHDFLRDNWDRTELGEEWQLFEEGGDLVGYEFPTGVGRIDLLARHRTDPKWLVIELKRGRSSDSTVGQVARYVGWVREHLAESGDSVEGMIIAHSADDKVRYALSVVPDIHLRTYEVDFRLTDPN